MGKILLNILKNIKYLLRAKSSSLIVIYGPLILIFLLGIAYDNANLQNVKVDVYSESYSELSDAFFSKLSETEFETSKLDSRQGCINNVKIGKSQVCIIFPPDMSVEQGKQNELEFYVDYSKLNLVWMVMDSVSTKIRAAEEEISFDLTSLILGKLKSTREAVSNNQKDLQKASSDAVAMQQQVKNIKKQLKQMDLNMNSEGFKTSDMKNINDDVLSDLKKYKQNSRSEMRHVKKNLNETSFEIEDKLDNIDRYLNNVEDEIDGFGNSTGLDFDGILSEVHDGQDVIKDIETLLKEQRNITHGDKSANRYENIKSNVNEVGKGLQNLQTKLSKLEKRFNKMQKLKTELANKAAKVERDFDNHIQTINNLKNSVNDIKNNINSISITEAADIANPIKTKVQPVTAEKTHLNYVFPGMIVLIIMFVTILLSSTIVGMERTSRAYFRNFVTPTKDFVYVISNYLTNLFLISVQLLVIIAISAIFFSTAVLENLGAISLILLLIASFFILLGMLLGYVFKSEETTTLAAVILSTVFLVFSGMIVPLESMSAELIKYIKYNPFIISETLLKQVMLFDIPLESMWQNLVLLASLSVGLVVVILILMKLGRGRVHRRHKHSKKTKTNQPIVDTSKLDDEHKEEFKTEVEKLKTELRQMKKK